MHEIEKRGIPKLFKPAVTDRVELPVYSDAYRAYMRRQLATLFILSYSRKVDGCD